VTKRILSLAFIGFTAITFITWSCTKLDTTTIGSDLIPAVDNINTFADTFYLHSTQGEFTGVYKDTTKLGLYEDYVLGRIPNDPLMGNTDATLFLQLKPGFYPYYISRDSIIAADSIVLCLNYKAFYGDSTTPVQFEVNEVASSAHGYWDSLNSLRDINFAPAIGTPLGTSPSIYIPALGNYVKIGKGKDSVKNQIRIKLSPQYVTDFFGKDSSAVPIDGAFHTDSTFRAFTNGFAIRATSGNALIYTSLNSENTRLELHYKAKNTASGVIDTVYTSLYFNPGGEGVPSRSAVADNIVRVRNGLTTGEQELALQTNPGTFATLFIDSLTNLSNRIVHRAELIIEQIPDPSDDIYKEPNFLYIDLVDSGTNKWKPIYYDLNPNTSYDPDFTAGIGGPPYYPVNAEVDFNYFGAFAKKKQDGVGGTRVSYTMNLTRYVQRLVTKQAPNYKFRLFPAHSFSYPQYASATVPYVLIPYSNSIAYGRVKVGGGSHPDPNYRMRMRIVYSKIK
jgi:hypothetical protein